MKFKEIEEKLVNRFLSVHSSHRLSVEGEWPWEDSVRALLPEALKTFGSALLEEVEAEFTDGVAAEISVANREGQPTSRLTSLAVKFGERIRSLRSSF